MARYNVGDKVVIVDYMVSGMNPTGMNKYLGTTMTIREVVNDSAYSYRMAEDIQDNGCSRGWYWSDDMIDHEATARLSCPIEYPGGYDIDYYTNKVYNMFERYDDSGELYSESCQFTREGIRANVEEWYRNKSKLFDLFRKHPNWQEEAKAIVFLKTEHRLPDVDCANSYIDAILRCRNNLITVDGKTMTITEYADIKFHNSETWKSRCESAGYNYNFHVTSEIDILRNILHNITCQSDINTISETIANNINAWFPSIHAHKGQKSSRVINKLFVLFCFDKLPDYNRIFAKLADSLNPFDVERITVFSLNIIDFLLMSHGNSWKSCHTILNSGNGDGYSGCYKGGTLSYANDGKTVIMYTVDKSYEGTDWCFEPKITRQLYFWDYPVLVQERLYPQCNDDTAQGDELVKQYRTVAEEVFATCLDMPNLWVKENRDRAKISQRKDTFMYPDWEHFNKWIVHIKKEIPVSETEIEEGCDTEAPTNYVVRSAKHISVGGTCYCTCCGEAKTDYYNAEKTLLCEDCDNTCTCAICGDRINHSDAYVYDEDYYCRDCVTYCEYHERYEPNSLDFTEVNNYGVVCENALENSDFCRCDCCGEYYWYTEVTEADDGRNVCDSCFEDEYAYCDRCGHVYRRDEMEEIDGVLYCSDCAEIIEAESSEDETA